MFARGSGAVPTELETWRYEDSDAPLVIRGIMKHKIIKQCWADKRPFWYMDSGYLGNCKYVKNPRGDKIWHRIVPNNLQHNTIIKRPPDRYHKLGLSPLAPNKNGQHVKNAGHLRLGIRKQGRAASMNRGLYWDKALSMSAWSACCAAMSTAAMWVLLARWIWIPMLCMPTTSPCCWPPTRS